MIQLINPANEVSCPNCLASYGLLRSRSINTTDRGFLSNNIESSPEFPSFPRTSYLVFAVLDGLFKIVSVSQLKPTFFVYITLEGEFSGFVYNTHHIGAEISALSSLC